MKKQNLVILVIFIFFMSSSLVSAGTDHAVTGDTIEIVTPGDRARICPYPLCGTAEHFARIKTGTLLKVIDYLKKYNVWVYEVNYQGKTGYISQFDVEKVK